MDMDWFGYGQLGVFGFVILIILISGFFQYLKVRSNNETIRRLAESGQTVDPQLLKSLGRDRTEDSDFGLLLGGFITLGVAFALVFFGHQIGRIEGDPELGQIFLAIAGFPGVVGVVLIVFGALSAMRKKSDKS